MIFTASLFDVLGIIDVLTTNQKVVSINDTLAFAQTETKTPALEQLQQNDFLNITQDVNVTGSHRIIDVTNNLHLVGKLTYINDIHFKDTLVFIQTLEHPHQFFDHLVFNETITHDNGIQFNDALEFTEVIVGNHKWANLPFSEQLILTDYFTFYKIPAMGRVSDLVYTPPITVFRNDFITFNYLHDVLVLRNPSFGNTFKYDFNRQQILTRGKTIIIAANSTYQYKRSVQSLSFTIENLKQIDSVRLFNFFNNSIGQPVSLVDYENVKYTLLITTPEIQFTQQSRDNFSTELEMEVLTDLGIIDKMSVTYLSNVAHLTN